MARLSLDEIRERRPTIDRAKMEATTEADIRRHAIEDGEDPDAAPAAGLHVLPPAEVRRRLLMSQSEFARAIHVPLKTVQNWEQGRTSPDPAARALLVVLAQFPFPVLSALNPGRDEEWIALTGRVAEAQVRRDLERDATGNGEHRRRQAG